jgi:protoporphyrinogen oxidase
LGKKVAVLGAGPMGLAVAYQLARDGHHPVVYEADDRIGGMTAAFDFSGLKIERYYHFHCISDHAFLNVLSELGLSDKMNWVPTKMGYWYLNQLQAWGNPIALLKFRGLGLVAKFRYGLHAFLSTKRDDWKPLDKVDAVRWIQRWVGPEAYEVLWRRLFDYKFYDYTSNLSAAWIWSRIRRIGRSRYSLFKEKLGYLEGGSETLLQGMHQDIIKNGGEVHVITGGEWTDKLEKQLHGINYTHKFSVYDHLLKTAEILGEIEFPDGTIQKKFDDVLWDSTKAEYCKENNIDLHIDDTLCYNDYFTTPFARLWSHNGNEKSSHKDIRHLD